MKRILFALLLFLVWISGVQAQTPFYQGKTTRILVGFTPGGSNDLWSRLIAQHMARYIPGQPTVIVDNLPGAGSIIAANHIYKAAKPDGLTIGHVSGNIFLNQLGERL